MSNDVETVTALLAARHTQAGEDGSPGFAATADEASGDVLVTVQGDDRWLLKMYAATIRDAGRYAGYRVAEHDDHLAVTLWPYDAKRDDPLTARRIPVVSSPYPSWKYEVCVVVSNDGLWPGIRPSDAEVRLIEAYIGYRMEWYNEGWRTKMRRRPLDIDSGTNTVILQKCAEGDWRYRRMTFEHGPWPSCNMPKRYTLPALLDHINQHSTRWDAYKAAHADVFEAAAS